MPRCGQGQGGSDITQRAEELQPSAGGAFPGRVRSTCRVREGSRAMKLLMKLLVPVFIQECVHSEDRFIFFNLNKNFARAGSSVTRAF